MNHTIFIRQGDTLTPMRPQRFDSEDSLQTLLAKYPDLLAGDQIDPGQPRRWLLIAREFTVPSAAGDRDELRLDHLFVDQEGVPTLVEVKRSANSELRREVVGQMLDYASRAVAHWSGGRLADRYVQRCSSEGLDAGRVLRDFLQPAEESSDPGPQFWGRTEANIRSGSIRLVFVAERIPEELKRIIEFLNTQMTMTEVLAVEIPQFVGANHPTLQTLVPRVFGITSESRSRKRTTGSAPTKWTKDEFVRHLEGTQGHAVAATAESLIVEAERTGAVLETSARSVQVWWPIVAKPVWSQSSDWICPFRLGDDGDVTLALGTLSRRPPFDQELKRREFVERVNKVPGVAVVPESMVGKPKLPLEKLSSAQSRATFLQAATWARDEAIRVKP